MGAQRCRESVYSDSNRPLAHGSAGGASLCIHRPTCGDALALEHNGDLYSCDHFVEPKYFLGNIKEEHMLDLVASDQQRKFGDDKRYTLPQYCLECPVRFACNGGCPRNRFIKTPDGEDGLNYLCAGYKTFFTQIDEPMRLMAALLKQGRYADEVMGILRQKVVLNRNRKPQAMGPKKNPKKRNAAVEGKNRESFILSLPFDLNKPFERKVTGLCSDSFGQTRYHTGMSSQQPGLSCSLTWCTSLS